MKKALLLLLIIQSLISLSFSQSFVQPSEGKSIVYFVPTYIEYSGSDKYRVISSEGAIEWMDARPLLVLFDDETYLGKYYGYENIYYECKPGAHLFWVGKRLINFIQVELLANKIYVIYIPIHYISPLTWMVGRYMEPFYPFEYNLFPINRNFNSSKYIGFSDYLTLRLNEKKHKNISEVIPTEKRKIKQINETKRKSKILYKYKLRAKEPIPALLPDMYIENSEKVLTE